MSNIQVTHNTDPNNARSESFIIINSNNPLQIVSGSKKFRNILNYDFTLATQFSGDGGLTWQDSAELVVPADAPILSDPALAWDDVGNVFLVALSGKNPPNVMPHAIEIYKSTDSGQTWSAPKRIHTSSDDDKQWAAGDSNPASPFHGRVYAVWDSSGGKMLFARTKDHGATWVGTGAGATPAGSVIVSGGSFAPEINVATNGDIYVVWGDGNDIKMIKSTDGGDSFNPAPSPATGITTLGSVVSPHFPNTKFRVGTLPTACVSDQKVVVAWADRREGPSRIYFALSNDGGGSWVTGSAGAPLLTGAISADLHHFDPQVVIDPDGVVGCAFYEVGPKPDPAQPLIDVIMAQSFDGGNSFSRFTITDRPWDPAVNAPLARGNPNVTFIGDYFGLDASVRGFYPLWTDTRTGIQELWTALVPKRNCQFIVNRSTLGQDEVDARRGLPPGSAVVPDAFRVVVDGFSAAQIGATSPASTLNVASPIAGMTIVCTGNTADLGNYGPSVQRFTFHYNVDFGPTDIAFNFPEPNKLITLNAAVGTVTAFAEIELVKQPDPFILHGDPHWLSVDLRVFVVRAREDKFGVPGVRDASDAPRFIRDLMTNITPAQFNSLSTGEAQSKLFLMPEDENRAQVFNFALAKVHYIGLIGATRVRVFFRMFQAQTTTVAFDFPPGSQYRRAPSNPLGQPIPLAGIRGNEFVTIPFFAESRIDTRLHPMSDQTDPPNVRNIAAHTDGSEVTTFFGCWLDINQPSEKVLPLRVPSSNVDGPFFNVLNMPVSIQQSILRNLHQCIIAEIAFDPIPIPPGKDPANWDKLAQRNIAWSDVGSAQAVTTFEIRPTPIGLPTRQAPDELMIDWGNLPNGSQAQIYCPAFKAAEVLDMADRMYTSHQLVQMDEHTIGCPTNGITYLPIPRGGISNFAGVLSVALPDDMERGEIFNVSVRQITNAFSQKGPVIFIAQPDGEEEDGENEEPEEEVREPGWRRVIGAFQLSIPVHTKARLLLPEERNLSLLRWIGETIPVESRWHPVFGRYLEVIADRVKAFGGDPDQVQPSPTGDGTTRTDLWCQRIAGLVIIFLAVWLVLLGLTYATPLSLLIPLVGILFLALIVYWQWRCKPDLCTNIWVLLLGGAGGAGLLGFAVLAGLGGPIISLVLAGSGIVVLIASLIAILRGCPPFFARRT